MRRAAALCCTGIGAGGRETEGGAEIVCLTRLVMGSPERGVDAVASTGLSGGLSAGLGSAGLGSARNSVALGSSGEVSAPTGRGRGKGFDSAMDDGAGRLITVPNIGAGCRPVCRNSALATIAPMAATATRPARVSLGLCSSTRSTRLRSVSTSMTAALAPRRRGAASSLADFLGTFLHQRGLVLNLVVRMVVKFVVLKFLAQHRRQGRDLALARLAVGHLAIRSLHIRRLGLRRVDQRQLDGDGSALAEPALYRQFAEMQRHQALHDRKSEAGAFMAALIGFAGLEELRADALEIVRCDADSGVADAQRKLRARDRRCYRDLTAALGELDGVSDEVEHDLLEGARIAGHDRQILRRIGDEIDAVLPRLQRQQIAAMHQ